MAFPAGSDYAGTMCGRYYNVRNNGPEMLNSA
jgi:hypothetical protein